MTEALSYETLQKQIAQSELGRELVSDPLMKQDIWSVKELGYTEDESKIRGIQNLHFENFSLPWLKLLTKLTVKATVREKCSLSTITLRIIYLKQLDKFLLSKGYGQPDLVTDALLHYNLF